MNYMTAEDKVRLEEQLKELKGKRKGLSDRIGRARELGDLSENAEYHSAKDDQGHNERKIRDLEEKLASAVVVNPEDMPDGMVFVGARWNFNKKRTKLGLEYNHGDQYWFNFAQAADDIIAPKTSTRGDVWEAYLLHRIFKKFIVRLNYLNYNYKYSGSGWHVGEPKELDTVPVLGFPTYSKASEIGLSFMARF